MKFSDFEEIMHSNGVNTLADIARVLDTTPQAVSNWKSRDQVPYHIENKINFQYVKKEDLLPLSKTQILNQDNEETISIPDILLTLAEQIKTIFLITFIFAFTTFIYVQYVQEEKFSSSATILLPETQNNNMGGLAGLASQFGVNVPTSNASIDLSSPSLIPELLKSRAFAEKILYKEFYSNKLSSKQPLVNILFQNSILSKESLIYKGSKALNGGIITYTKNPLENFSMIKVTLPERQLAKNLADSVLFEIEELNKSYKIQSTNEKISFIETRINSVYTDLTKSEIRLKNFNEKNRQISSPALQLELDRLARDVELQKNIYLTLKQQLELAKIEEVQKASAFQILDKPFYPLQPINKNLQLSLIFSISTGLFVGVILGFMRSYRINADKSDKKKYRKMKLFLIKNIRNYFLDFRIISINTFALLAGLPFLINHQIDNNDFYLLPNLVYLIITIISLMLLFLSRKRSSKNHV